MKKKKLGTKVVISTLAISGLFLGGVYLAQTVSEKEVVASAKKESNTPEIEDAEKMFEKIDEMSIYDYYIGELKSNPEIITVFEKNMLLILRLSK